MGERGDKRERWRDRGIQLIGFRVAGSRRGSVRRLPGHSAPVCAKLGDFDPGLRETRRFRPRSARNQAISAPVCAKLGDFGRGRCEGGGGGGWGLGGLGLLSGCGRHVSTRMRI